MTGAEETSLAPMAAVAATASPAARRRGRLVRKYALLFIVLVGVALVANSALDFWFSYQENKEALVRVQQEKADAAAQRIEEFAGEIERQIGWTTHAQWSAGPLDQRRFDYVRLQRQVPAITELSQLDADGKEQLKVSRLAMDVVASGQNFSASPAFTEAKAHGKWFSPVYFRKESEPYMTLAIARAGRNAGVTVAEINLKLIWNVITALEIGQGGYAYVVDEHGRLIAHPDISLVLRDTDLSKLPQVAIALATPREAQTGGALATGAPAGGTRVAVAKNIGGRSVLTAHAAIAPLGWLIFVEVPLSEAFAPLYGAAWRTGFVLVFGLLAAALAALVLARRMTGPIRAIQAGAAQIGAGALDRRIDIHTGDELEELADQFNRMAYDLQTSYAELESKVEERTAELSEALDQQTATAEVLGVINSSPGDLAPVFDAMLARAMRLCEAAYGILWTYDGECFRPAVLRGLPEIFAELFREPVRHPHPEIGLGRILRGEGIVINPDMAAEAAYRDGDPIRCAMVDIAGARSCIQVSLRKDAVLLGAIVIFRKEMLPFSDKQIALLENFAAQAVIAMENARLITETQEALDQQTATAEVLQVINSSPGDLAPVFDAILEKAHSLCESNHGTLFLSDDGYFRPVAMRGVPERFAERLRRGFRGEEAFASKALVAGERYIHVADMAALDNPLAQAAVEQTGTHTLLSVPLRQGDALLGMIVATRQEVRPFSDKQIALLQNFAAQAVIAMENARLITETQEALDQQTATADVLQVINGSPGDLVPVFDAMLEKAISLCEATFGTLWTYDGENMHAAAVLGATPRYTEFLRSGPHQPSPIAHQPLLTGAPVVHIADVSAHEGYQSGPALPHALVDLGGVRTLLAVPLRKDAALLGVFSIYRDEVRPFSDKQIALLQNFAAQAVIAMENARLITETQEALDQQTATAEVLGVINSSPGDLAPVFDAMLEKATRLCEGSQGVLWTLENGSVRPAAMFGVTAEYAAFLRRGARPGPKTPFGRIMQGERVVEILDLAEDEGYRAGDPVPRAAVEIGGFRSMVFVALLRDEVLLGAFAVARREVKPFSPKQIALLQNFAAQAVIAMENARLITETREALDQQTATAEVLGVINSSPGDLKPVFDSILEKAHSLCGAEFGGLLTYDGESVRLAAERNLPPSWADLVRGPWRPGPDHPVSRIIQGERLFQVDDMAEVARTQDDPMVRAAVELGGIRTLLLVPLRKDDAFLGYITAYRQEVRPFTEKQIALLENFAAQAVIAMENARLLDQIRQRQAELRVTFDNMADGVAMFDAALRLAAWNRNFQETVDLPDDFLAEPHDFEEYIRYLTERGEFGNTSFEAEITRLRARYHEHYSFERTRPDGRVIEVRHNPMPEGGFVLIYSDITERKRSEAEIRAARDAAEAALRDLKAAQANLVQAEKMASLGQLTAGIAHEIKNPLNFVNNFASLSVELLDELKEAAGPALATLDADKRADVDDVVGMLTGNLEKIGEHSRGASGERREVDLNGLVEEALNLAYHGARAQDQSFNITLERELAESISPIALAPQEMTRAFLNLFGNGFYAANKRLQGGADPQFKPVLTVKTCDLGDGVEVRVRDNGTGIPPEIKDKLFQPFFTTKPTGEGTGLGLSISYDIVTKQHGGAIEVDSRLGEFTEFTVRLPRNGHAAAAA
jgi:GAF domain-containing protein/nitrogen-specific signal transduction histidine kinase